MKERELAGAGGLDMLFCPPKVSLRGLIPPRRVTARLICGVQGVSPMDPSAPALEVMKYLSFLPYLAVTAVFGAIAYTKLKLYR